MNEKIKQILEKQFHQSFLTESVIKHLKPAIIEICEEQKKECAKWLPKDSHFNKLILNSKNIAE